MAPKVQPNKKLKPKQPAAMDIPAINQSLYDLGQRMLDKWHADQVTKFKMQIKHNATINSAL